MRLLVYPHDLGIGGSQINAIDLAAGAARAGHDVMVYGRAGPLVEYVNRLGLQFIPANEMRYRPAPTRVAELAHLARRYKLDLIHAYEWPPCLDAYFGAGLFVQTPVLCTVLSMSVMPYVPASMPLIMGTAELGEQARKVQAGKVWVLEPPIDTSQDHPGIDGSAFRAELRVPADELLVVSVSRLAVDLKLDALVRAIDAVDVLAARHAVRLVLVGDGAARDALTRRARAVNDRWGREVITLAGSLLDPRPAYAAADIVVGMGSSALRAMSIGRPVVVQGEEGFSEIVSPDTLDTVLWQGFYGRGDCSSSARLVEQIERLLSDRARRDELGKFGTAVVTRRFSLQRALELQLKIYSEVLAEAHRAPFVDVLRCAKRALMLEVDNHNPFHKRRARQQERRLLYAAGSGTWPPP